MIRSLTFRNTESCSSVEPVVNEGSGKLICICRFTFPADSNDKIPFVAGEVIYMVWLQIMNRGSYFVHYFNG